MRYVDEYIHTFAGEATLSLLRCMAIANGNNSLDNKTLTQSEATRNIVTYSPNASIADYNNWLGLMDEIYYDLNAIKSDPNSIRRYICRLMMKLRIPASYFHTTRDNANEKVITPGGMMDGSMVQNLDIMNVPSRRRNLVVADIFNRLQYMDRRGSGFKKILGDYRIYEGVSNSAKPVFNSELSSFFITLPNLQYAINGGDVVKDVVKDVTKEQLDILDIMIQDSNVTASESSQKLGLTSRHIQRPIKDLADKGIIRREGGRKLGKWVIVKDE